MHDFFFGKIWTLDKSREPYIGLSDAVEMAEKVGPAFFTEQLNRILQATNNQLVLSDGTSYPCFSDFLDRLVESQIGFVEVKARSDVNPNVKFTLECSIWLAQGVIHVRPHWCAYKPIRADEIVSTLLVPLHRKGLVERTYIRWSADEVEPFPEDPRQQIKDVFTLSGYPNGAVDHTQRDRMSEYEQELRLAISSAPV